ncbi:MAG: hypothetical protein PHY80_02605 [Rickettsiales bacterium]|nr:hypothetical protein [Rickettsiales bacterium]
MISRRLKISKEDRKRLVDYLESNPPILMEQFLKEINLPKQMDRILYYRFLKRNHIKVVQDKLRLTQDIVSDRTTQGLAIVLKYVKAKNVDITVKLYDKLQ